MLCPQHMLCEMVSFSTSKPSWNTHSTQQTLPRGTKLFIYSQQWLLCLLLLGRFCCFLTSPSTETIKAKKKKKGWKGHWLTTDPWLSFENLRLQIKLSGFKEQRCHSPAPGHSMSATSFEGLTCIFLSCQGRVMGAKENRGAQRSSHSQIARLFEILNCVIKEAAHDGITKTKHKSFNIEVFHLDLSASTGLHHEMTSPVSLFMSRWYLYKMLFKVF